MAEENAASESSSSQTSLHDLFSADPKPEVEKASSADEKSSEKDDKDEGDQKFRATESSPDEDQDDKDEKSEKPADKKETPDEKKADPEKSEKKEEKPSDEKAQKDKWESEENPYIKRHRDTAANWNKEHQQNLQLHGQLTQMQQEIATLRKIADGTYDPEKDDPSRQITPEHVATTALQAGKSLASRNAAISQYGEEKVNADLNEFHQVFGNHGLVQQMVLNSDAPVHEAFRILERYRFEKQYGSTPDDWKKSIRAEVEKELRPILTQEITEKIMGREDKKSSTPRGLSSSRGSNGLGSGQNSKGKGPVPLNKLFEK